MTALTREARRGARIAASFWIGVDGSDPQPVLRRGDLSASGIYFETDRSLGASGSVQFLHIESEDRKVVVQVLTRIIRVTQSDDIVHGSKLGVAAQFMPSSLEGRHNLERLVRHVVEIGLGQQESVAHGFGVSVAGNQSDRTSLQHLSVQKLVLETDWRPSIGDQLEFDIRSSQQHVPLAGQVVAVDPTESGYRVEIRVTGLSPDTKSANVGTAFTSLIAEPIDDFSLPTNDLSGQLSRIKLPTLLGLMEMEKMSGRLDLTSPNGEAISLFVREGRLLDGDSETSASIREILASAMSWADGEFNFTMEEVEREDKVGASMTSLILDLAREEDESTKSTPESTDTDFF